MVEWVALGTGPRPVPQPFTTPLIWAGAFGGALTVVVLSHTVVGPDRPELTLAALSLLAAILGVCARFTAAPGTTALRRLFLNGFAIPPVGSLTWTGSRDTLWLSCLLAATVAGTTAARLTHARAAYRRLTA
ncbi:hypothetical protein [Streptomyces sp. P9-A2]|uniref:hypothetical protein n=1 Tax=Streptomyces sp. P9-A2 TaxID=3072284 RepID=UPI002FC66405